MAAPKAVRDRIVPGATFEVTNHYITSETHPWYGTSVRTVERVTSSHLWFRTADDNGRLEWPKASAVEVEGDEIRFYGMGAAQGPTDLFLTLKPVTA